MLNKKAISRSVRMLYIFDLWKITFIIVIAAFGLGLMFGSIASHGLSVTNRLIHIGMSLPSSTGLYLGLFFGIVAFIPTFLLNYRTYRTKINGNRDFATGVGSNPSRNWNPDIYFIGDSDSVYRTKLETLK